MDTMLIDGDYAVDARGLPVTITGAREIIQQALIRLGVRKGSVSGCPALGSELYRLSGLYGTALDRAAMSYVREALSPMREIHALNVVCESLGGGALAVKIEAAISGRNYMLEVKAN